MHTDATRAVIAVTGDDRHHFLQGIITQDIHLVRPDRGQFAAILSPQGKVLHDFFLLQHNDAILIDCDAAQKDTLLKRLTMYMLRAKVTLSDDAAHWRVAYRTKATHAAIGHVTVKKSCLVLTDPRAGELGERIYLQADGDAKNTATMADYHDHRIRLGIPDGTRDLTDDVAMDAGYDLLGAISFTKGCYVGQEVTARMHYKNIARKGFYCFNADQPLPAAGATITAEGVALGTLRGTLGQHGLAMLKFEETEAALARGALVTVDNHALRLHAPAWLQPKLAQFRAARENQ